MDAPALPERRLSQAIRRAHERGSLLGTAIGLLHRAQLRRMTGQLLAAREDAESGLAHAARANDDFMIA